MSDPKLNHYLFLFCLVIFLGVAAVGVARAADSPLAALVQAQRGIDEANSDLFNAVVDVSSVVDRAAGVLIAVFREQAAGSTGFGGEILGDNMAILAALAASTEEGAGHMALLRPLMISEARDFVVAGINGGHFAGKPDPSVVPSRSSLAGILRKMPEGRREIVPGKLRSQRDGRAHMSATFNAPGAGSLPLELVFEQHNTGWRVVEIANVKELFYEAAKKHK